MKGNLCARNSTQLNSTQLNSTQLNSTQLNSRGSLTNFFIAKRRWFFSAAIGVFVFWLVQFTYKKLWTFSGIIDTPIGDYGLYSTSAARLLAGDPLYFDGGAWWGAFYDYPPLLAVMLTLVAGLPFYLQNLLWYAVITACAIGSFLGIFKLAEILGIAPPRGWKLIAAAILFTLFFEPAQNNYLYAQANFPVLLCCVAFIYLQARGKICAAAAGAGLGAALKLTPLIFFPYLLWRREWRALAIATLIFLGGFAAAFFFAVDAFIPDFLHFMRVRFSLDYTAHLPFYATLYRMVIWFFPSLASLITQIICVGLLLGGVMTLDRSRRADASSPRATIWLGALLCNLMLLIHPMTQAHAVIFCFPAYWLSGLYAWFRGGWKIRIAWLIAYALYFPLLDGNNTPIMTLSLLLNSTLCALIFYRETREKSA